MGRAKTVKNFIHGKLIYGHSLWALVSYSADWHLKVTIAWHWSFYSAVSYLSRKPDKRNETRGLPKGEIGLKMEWPNGKLLTEIVGVEFVTNCRASSSVSNFLNLAPGNPLTFISHSCLARDTQTCQTFVCHWFRAICLQWYCVTETLYHFFSDKK